MYSDRLFVSEVGAYAYINRDYNTSNKYLYFKENKNDKQK